jgi:hypothetical protein
MFDAKKLAAWHFTSEDVSMRCELRFVAALTLFLTGAVARQARADFVSIGGTYSVNNTNFVDTFTQNVTFDGTGVNKSIDGGKLLINEQVSPTGTKGAWIVFNYSTSNGGPLAGDINGNWQAEVDSIPFTTPVVFDGLFAGFSANGVPFSNVQAGDFSGVETNPVTGNGEVLFDNITPSSPLTSLDAFVFFNPYSVLGSDNNIDPNTANGHTFGVHVDLPSAVPEPSTLTLLGVGIGGVFARAWRHRRRLLATA